MPAPGMFGRKPPDLTRPALVLAPYLTGVVPAHPAATDYLGKLSGWKMLGNDQYGDCVAVTWANTRRLVTSYLTTEHYPPMADVLTVYKTQNPGFPSQDDGMDIQVLLGWLVKNAPPDGVKALGFAKVDHNNVEQVKAAIAIFGSVWTGIDVQSAQETQFGASQPWDWVPGSPLAGGHSIITGGYDMPRAGKLGGDEDFITWAQETSFTDNYWTNGVEECWVVIWPEHLGSRAFLEGVDLAAFAADYTAITGRPFPVPVPAPLPPPLPPPVSRDPADLALAQAVSAWASAHHSGTNKAAAQAIRVWLAAKGLATSRLVLEQEKENPLSQEDHRGNLEHG